MGQLKFLTPEQKKNYEENGFAVLKDIFTKEEIDEICQEYDDIFARKGKSHKLESTWVGEDTKQLAGNRAVSVLSIHNLQMHSAVFTRLITNKRLLDALEDIMGNPNIVLHHTKAHIKPPEKGAPFLMHQDYPYFPHKSHTMLAVFLHLDDTTPENGGLALYPGSHKLGPLPAKQTVDASGNKFFYVDPEKFPLSGATPTTAKRGDIIVFSYLTLHGSYLNLSERTRRMFLIQLKAADDEPVDDQHKSPCQGMCLRGKNVSRSAEFDERHKH